MVSGCWPAQPRMLLLLALFQAPHAAGAGDTSRWVAQVPLALRRVTMAPLPPPAGDLTVQGLGPCCVPIPPGSQCPQCPQCQAQPSVPILAWDISARCSGGGRLAGDSDLPLLSWGFSALGGPHHGGTSGTS